MKLPVNKFAVAALLWFVLGIYSLLFRESSNEAPPFLHFDKVAHFGLFFAQIWLCARAFIQEKLAIPYRFLILFAFAYALVSEWGQATLTATRQGSVADGIADLLGAFAALWVATCFIGKRK